MIVHKEEKSQFEVVSFFMSIKSKLVQSLRLNVFLKNE